MRRAIIFVIVIAAFGLGFLLRGGNDHPTASDPGALQHTEAEIWTCSMHPQIKLPKPGKCPICFMDLIPLVTDDDAELGPRTLRMSAAAMALAEIQTTTVARGAAQTVLPLIGRLDYDETRQRIISSWVPGRIDTLLVDFTGDVVTVGEPLVSLYSPELYSAQTELLSSIEASTALESSSDPLLRRTAAATVNSARERLGLWGLSDQQIAAVEARGTATDHIRIRAPVAGIVIHKNATEGQYVKTGAPLYTVADLSWVWLIIDAYETDLPWLRTGQTVDFTVAALPGRTFSGKIIFIDPVLNSRTRTAEIRVEVPNPDGALKPGLFADASVSATLGHRGLPSDGQIEEPLVIPATAPLITGKRAVVYVREPDTEKPTFTGREITLGPRADDLYIVLSGLAEGERVVTNGAFKIDSALQIQAKPSMMGPGGGPVPGHNHGGAATAASGTQPMTAGMDNAPAKTFVTPPTFTKQLGAVLDQYLQVQQALAADDSQGASTVALKMASALQAVDMTLLTGDSHMAWMKDQSTLEKHTLTLTKSENIAGQRQALLELGPALWSSLERFGYHEERTVRKFHCPMADNNKGGDWIQLGATTANPFFGSAMPRCGSQTDSLTTTATKQGESR